MDDEPGIVLSSGSKRRREIVRAIDAAVEVIPSYVEERPPLPDEDAEEYVAQMAADKARRAAANARAGSLVIGADTAVVLGKRILGKPADESDAKAMLTALRGHSHRVVTGVMVVRGDMEAWSVTSSEVVMRTYSDAEIERYAESGEPLDKAGGYAIQDPGFAPASGLGGCYLNVVGLPLCEVVRLSSAVGVDMRLKPGGRTPERCPADCPLRVTAEVVVT